MNKCYTENELYCLRMVFTLPGKINLLKLQLDFILPQAQPKVLDQPSMRCSLALGLADDVNKIKEPVRVKMYGVFEF